MNIFYTNPDPVQCAREHCNVHVNKMIVEYSQLLSTAHRELDGDGYADRVGLYKSTHVNHPSAVWVRQSSAHYDWLYDVLVELCCMFEERTGKLHKCTNMLHGLVYWPTMIPSPQWKDPTPAMPDRFKCFTHTHGTAVAYQRYLKDKFNGWTTRTDKRRMKVEFQHGTPCWL